MSAPTLTPAATRAPVLDLDARLALVGAAMTARLDEAAVAFEVNTAHIPAEPVDLADVITGPVPLTAPAPRPCPYSTPVAALLHRARTRLEAGWCTGRLRDEQGARCLIGAIRAEAHSGSEADDACRVLLEAIRRDLDPDADTVPSWNDTQTGPRLPLRALDRAAGIADGRAI